MDLLKQAGDLLRVVAPALGTALGGPIGGLAAQTISNLLLGKPDATSDEMSAALISATPEQLAKLKELDNTFKVQMKQLDIDLEKISSEDRDSARKREMEVKDWTPRLIALLTIVAFFTYIAAVTFFPFHVPPDMALVNLAIGWIGGVATNVVSYYFGSSSGSDAKNRTIEKLSSQ